MNTKFHFIGIGGIGMGAIASLLMDQGMKVTGSDIKDNDMTKSLRAKGAEVFIGHARENVGVPDIVVFSSAIDKNNPEILETRRNQIELIPRGKLLAYLMKQKISITVAGTHGKTTTSSMVSSLLTQANLEPTTAVGGIINCVKGNAVSGKGMYFVAEVDESDGSFLHFSPAYSIITNMEYEHVDYFKSFEKMKERFSDFISNTVKYGYVIVYGDDTALLDLVKESGRRALTYGFGEHNDVRAKSVEWNGFGSTFECEIQGRSLGRILLNVPGEHNVLNALATIGLGYLLSIEEKIIRETLAEYEGVQRRFQVLSQKKDITVVDDYAHHPTEITYTLKAAREAAVNRVFAVFQPHRYSRFAQFREEFAECLRNCDHLIITDIYGASEQPIAGADVHSLVRQIHQTMDKPVVYLPKEKIADYLVPLLMEGDLVITLGAGDINKIGYQLGEILASSQSQKVNIAKKV